MDPDARPSRAPVGPLQVGQVADHSGPTGDPVDLFAVTSGQIGAGAAHDTVQPSPCSHVPIAKDGICPSRK